MGHLGEGWMGQKECCRLLLTCQVVEASLGTGGEQVLVLGATPEHLPILQNQITYQHHNTCAQRM